MQRVACNQWSALKDVTPNALVGVPVPNYDRRDAGRALAALRAGRSQGGDQDAARHGRGHARAAPRSPASPLGVNCNMACNLGLNGPGHAGSLLAFGSNHALQLHFNSLARRRRSVGASRGSATRSAPPPPLQRRRRLATTAPASSSSLQQFHPLGAAAQSRPSMTSTRPNATMKSLIASAGRWRDRPRIAEVAEELAVGRQQHARVAGLHALLIGLHGAVEGEKVRIAAKGLGEDAVALGIAFAARCSPLRVASALITVTSRSALALMRLASPRPGRGTRPPRAGARRACDRRRSWSSARAGRRA